MIVVHYCRSDDTLRCVESLRQLDYRDFFVVVVDSASPDGSGAVVKELIDDGDRFRVILSPENVGYAAANNIGIRYAGQKGAELIWLVNPDATVEPLALKELAAAAAAHPDVDVFGSKILRGATKTRDGQTQAPMIWSAGAEIDFSQRRVSMLGSDERDDGQFDRPRGCDYLPGCSLLFRTEVLGRSGYLPEDYFMYFEETDWCTRIKRSGGKLRYVPASVVYHHFDGDKLQSPFNVYYYNRNARLFWFRHGSPAVKLRTVIDTLCRDLPRAWRALRHARGQADRDVFRAHLRSCLDFLLLRFGHRYSDR